MPVRHRWLILTCVALVTVGAAYGTWRRTPIYGAAASIEIDAMRSNAMRSSGSRGDLLDSTYEREITTEIEVLGSRSLAAEVVDALGLQLQLTAPDLMRNQVFSGIEVLRRSISDSTSSDSTSPAEPESGEYRLLRRPNGRYALLDLAAGRQLDVVAPGERLELHGLSFAFTPPAKASDSYDFVVLPFQTAVDMVQGSVHVVRATKTGKIARIEYEDSDAQLARDVPNALALRYIARRRTMAQTESERTAKFVRDQMTRLRAVIEEQEDSLRRFRTARQIVSLGDEARTQVQRLAELRGRRAQLDGERSALAALLKDASATDTRRSPSDPSPYLYLTAFPTLLRNQASAELLNSLHASEDLRAELLARRTPADPDVQAVADRIAKLEAQLHGMATMYYRGLGEQVVALDVVIAQEEARLSTLPAKQVQLSRLDRETKVLQSVYALLETRLQESQRSAAAQGSRARVVAAAELPEHPLQPTLLVNLVLAMAAGLMCGISVAFAREYLDKSVHSRMDVRAITRVPVLGLIPRIERTGRRTTLRGTLRPVLLLTSRVTPRTEENEATAAPDGAWSGNGARVLTGIPALTQALDRLATNVAFAEPGGTVRTLLVTSPAPREGKTTVALNLALTMAQRGRQVLLIDANLRRGQIHEALRTPRDPGLSDVLLLKATFSAALRQISVGDDAMLHFLTSGSFTSSPAHLLAREHAHRLLESIRSEYELIILDSPALNVVSDAALLVGSSDGVILVARAGATASGALALAMEQLRAVRARVIGTVLNDVGAEGDVRDDATWGSDGHDATYYAESTSERNGEI